jgi:outer membrane protein assembly factor BamB
LHTVQTFAGRIYIGGGERTGGDKRGVFQCLDAATGAILWRYEAPHRQFPAEIEPGKKFMLGRITPNLGICSTPTVDGDRVYFVNHRAEVLCLSTKDWKILWTFDLWEHGVRPSDACNGSPLIDGDILYVNSSNGVGHGNVAGEFVNFVRHLCQRRKKFSFVRALEME